MERGREAGELGGGGGGVFFLVGYLARCLHQKLERGRATAG